MIPKVDAAHHLGILLTDGDGVKQDVLAGVGWFEKSAEGGHVVAMYVVRVAVDGCLCIAASAPNFRKHRQCDTSLSTETTEVARLVQHWLQPFCMSDVDADVDADVSICLTYADVLVMWHGMPMV